MSAELGEELQHGALLGPARGGQGRGWGRRTLSTITHDACAPPDSSSDLHLFVFTTLHKCKTSGWSAVCIQHVFAPQIIFELSVCVDCCVYCDVSVGECVWLTRHGLDGWGPDAVMLSQNIVSTVEFRASPGRAELGLRLRLVRAVWGSENIGGCARDKHNGRLLFWQ